MRAQGHIESRAARLGIAEGELKLPPAVSLAACATRERDWANVVTAHQGEAAASTWLLSKYRCVAGTHPPAVHIVLHPHVSGQACWGYHSARCGRIGCELPSGTLQEGRRGAAAAAETAARWPHAGSCHGRELESVWQLCAGRQRRRPP